MTPGRGGAGVGRGSDRMHAIETPYAGVLFRSRLEAKWAATFDQLGWHWDYEPEDYPGWIPDFRLYGTTDILCEVKGAHSILDGAAQEGVMDVWRSAPQRAHVLLLLTDFYAYLREPGHPVPDVYLGAPDPWRTGWGGAVFGQVGDKFDVWHFWGSSVPLLAGEGSGWPMDHGDMNRIWRESGNRTKWKPRK